MAQFVIISKGYKILSAVSDCCQETLSSNLNNSEGWERVQGKEAYYSTLWQKLDRERNYAWTVFEEELIER